MDNARLADLLVQIGMGDRLAFRALFDEFGPEVAARAAAVGVPRHAVAEGLTKTLVQLWEGEYEPPPLTPTGEVGRVTQWLCNKVVEQANSQSKTQQPPLVLDDYLWAEIEKRAYPESLKNILRRLDVLFALAAAAVWAVLLLLLT